MLSMIWRHPTATTVAARATTRIAGRRAASVVRTKTRSRTRRSGKRSRSKRRTHSGFGAAAAAMAAATTATTSMALCQAGTDSPPVNWKMTLGVSAAVAVVAGSVAALFMPSRSDDDDGGASSSDEEDEDETQVAKCTVLPMPPRGRKALTDGSSGPIVLGNELGTTVTWGVASAQGRRQYMEDEWCAGVIVPQIEDGAAAGADGASTSHAAAAGASSEEGAGEDQGEQAELKLYKQPTSFRDGPPLYVLGVFDGHGGGTCSSWASRQMLSMVASHISSTTHVKKPQDAVERALASLEDDMVGKQALTCGTTAIVVAMTHDGKLVVGNVGDSRAMICNGTGCDAETPDALDSALRACAACALSVDHKPDGEDRARVEAAGGGVRFEGCQRVYINSGPHKGKGGLAMSRALGDKFYKIKPYVQDESKPIVSAQPDFQHHTINEDDSWCILASDGLWDVITPDRVCDILSKNVEGHKCDPQIVASELVKFALGQGSSDNITVLALRFDHASSTSSSSVVQPEDAAQVEAVE